MGMRIFRVHESCVSGVRMTGRDIESGVCGFVYYFKPKNHN